MGGGVAVVAFMAWCTLAWATVPLAAWGITITGGARRRGLTLVVVAGLLVAGLATGVARLARLGAVVLPAMPGFYHRPRTKEDLVHHVVGKVLDRLGVEHALGARWQGLPPPEDPGVERAREEPS